MSFSTNKERLIKAILSKDKERLQTILNESLEFEELQFFEATGEGNYKNQKGKLFTLSEIEQNSLQSGCVVFIPADSLTDEQIERYQTETTDY